MTCLEMHGLLPRIAERDGTPRVALDAARHLAVCPGCAAELLRLRELNGLLDRLPLAEVPDSFPARVLRALRTKGGAGAILFALLALATGTGTLTMHGGADSVLTLLTGPVEAASSIAGALAHIALALLAAFQDVAGGVSLVALPAGRTARSVPGGLHLLALIAAAAFVGSWAAFGWGALRFHREQRTSDR